MNKKHLYIILLILPFIVFSQLEEKSLLEQLHEMVTEENKLLPLDGGEVVWEKVTLDGVVYTYHYIIKEKNHLKEIDELDFITFYCSEPDVQWKRENNVPICWQYFDLDGNIIRKIVVDRDQCD